MGQTGRATVTNWAQTYASAPRVLRRIESIEQLLAALAEARAAHARVRLLGSAQSPSDIAMSDDHLFAMRGLNRVRWASRERCEVEVEAGVTLGELAQALDREGLALPNLGSILRQTVGGAASTGTHGTGLGFGSIPSIIQEMEMATVAGELVRVSAEQNAELFQAGRISLGSLGVHTAFRLKVVPAFDLRVEEGPVALAQALRPEWYSGADHARVWYLPYVDHAWGWRATRILAGGTRSAPWKRSGFAGWLRDRGLGYHAFQAGLWLAASAPSLLPSVNRAYSRVFFTRARSSSGPSVEQFTFDCLFHQRVAEWAVPLEAAAQAALGIRELAERGGFHAHLPVEIRYTAGDDMWLSPTYGGPRCWIGIVSYIPWNREVEWRPFFTAVEQQMLSLGGRPHWAKELRVGPAGLRALYPRWDEFQSLRARMDPEHRLRNAYTDRVLDAAP